MKPAVIATWRFGRHACEETLKNLLSGENALDSVVRGVRVTEDDPTVDTVGYGGAPNADGIVELDAAVMWGPGRHLGAVAGLHDIKEAISVARVVMEETPHCVLVGQSARQFALDHGFTPSNLLTEYSRERWEEWKRTGIGDEAHDTVCVLGVDQDGDICAGTSTSGLRYKLPGRVGDTPFPGCGLYCDNEVGAAAGTGIGEDIMRYAMSFRIVEEMRRGVDPMEACRSTIKWAVEDDERVGKRLSAVIAITKDGRWGAAATQTGFTANFGDEENGVQMFPIPGVLDE